MSPLSPGKKAPGFDLAGEDSSPRVFKAQPSEPLTLLAFYKDTCPVCQFTFPFLQRLHERYKVLSGHHKKAVVVVAALARELCGFVWAIACQVSAPHKVKMRGPTTVKEIKPARPKISTVVKTSRTAAAAKRKYVLDATKKFKK